MKILLIEDDEYTSQLLSATLSAHRYAVDTIADGAAGLDLAVRWNYDLILLDILLPKIDGIEVCRRLRAQGCQTPILMLTVKGSDEDVIAGLDAGADDYVAKSCNPAQLLARVRALLRRGENAASSPVLTWGRLRLDPALVQVTYNQKPIPLRSKEYSLLELFLRHPQHTLSRSAIIDHLWSIDETPVEGSVTNLIKDLRQRLKSIDPEADLIETVYGLGYRLKTAPIESEQTPKPEDAKQLDQDVDSLVNRGAQEQRGRTAIEQITERFRNSLEQRIDALEVAERSLQAGHFSLTQQAATRIEVHKLAGGLGTFGCVEASKTAQAIEDLLDQMTEEPQFVNQFTQLLKKLKQDLAISYPSKFYRSHQFAVASTVGR